MGRTGLPQYAHIEDQVLQESDVWQERMGLAHFEIEHNFVDAYYENDNEDNMKITAYAETRWNYQMARITWFMRSAVNKNPEQIERVLVHELSHVLLAPEQVLVDAKLYEIASSEQSTSSELDALADQYYERLEMSTENVTRALVRAFGLSTITA